MVFLYNERNKENALCTTHVFKALCYRAWGTVFNQRMEALLPVVKSEVNKNDIKRLMEILGTKEFTNYKQAQGEIDIAESLTDRNIQTIRTQQVADVSPNPRMDLWILHYRQTN
jgi:hypothetical protein